MRKFFGTLLLTIALSCAAYAGDMPFPVATPQPTPTSTQTDTQESIDDDVQGQTTTESTVVEVTLTFIQNVLSLF